MATRTVFNGLDVNEMFTEESVSLPELAPGEILVKVINIFSRTKKYILYFFSIISKGSFSIGLYE